MKTNKKAHNHPGGDLGLLAEAIMGQPPIKKVTMIDLTPSWVSLVPLFHEFIRDGTPNQKDLACDEFAKLAAIADDYIRLKKEGVIKS